MLTVLNKVHKQRDYSCHNGVHPLSIVWEYKCAVTLRLQRHAPAKIKPGQPPPSGDWALGQCLLVLQPPPQDAAAGFAKWTSGGIFPEQYDLPTRGDLTGLTWPKRLGSSTRCGQLQCLPCDECGFSVYRPCHAKDVLTR